MDKEKQKIEAWSNLRMCLKASLVVLPCERWRAFVEKAAIGEESLCSLVHEIGLLRDYANDVINQYRDAQPWPSAGRLCDTGHVVNGLLDAIGFFVQGDYVNSGISLESSMARMVVVNRTDKKMLEERQALLIKSMQSDLWN